MWKIVTLVLAALSGTLAAEAKELPKNASKKPPVAKERKAVAEAKGAKAAKGKKIREARGKTSAAKKKKTKRAGKRERGDLGFGIREAEAANGVGAGGTTGDAGGTGDVSGGTSAAPGTGPGMAGIGATGTGTPNTTEPGVTGDTAGTSPDTPIPGVDTGATGPDVTTGPSPVPAPGGGGIPVDADRETSLRVHQQIMTALPTVPGTQDLVVSSAGGRVTVQGNVNSELERDLVLEQARSVPGVTEVVDRLTIEEPAQ